MQPCDLQHLCLRCRARHTRSEYDQWDLTDSRVAAHVLLHMKQKIWKVLNTNSICEYLLDLDHNLIKRPSLQKAVSHFGALRISSDKFKTIAAAELLNDFDVWEAEVDGDRHYLATYDPMNDVYAAWLYHVANGPAVTGYKH